MTAGSGARMVVERARGVYGLGVGTYKAWRADRTMRFGAGLAYYALFTIVPFLAFAVATVERVFGRGDIEAELTRRIAGLGIAEAPELAATLSEAISKRSVQSSLGLLGLVSLIIAASLVFIALVDAVNMIWRIPVRSGLRQSIRRRLIGFVMLVATVGFLAVEFAISAVAGTARALMPGDVAVLDDLAELFSAVVSLSALAVVLILLNHMPCRGQVSLRPAIVSGVVTAVGLVLGTWAFGLYIRTFGGASLTGAFGAVLAFLTWVYFEAQILLFGVQLTKQLAISEGFVEPPNEREQD